MLSSPHSILSGVVPPARRSMVNGELRKAGFESNLRVLEDYLKSDRCPSNSMEMFEVDGFITAIAIGPETILPSEWTPYVWDGETPVFDDQAEGRAVMSGLMTRYNDIVREAKNGKLQPVVWRDATGSIRPEEWAAGFGRGLALRSRAWLPLLRDQDARALLLPILIAVRGEAVATELGLDEYEFQVLRESIEALPNCVNGVARFWREHRVGGRAASLTGLLGADERASAKIGRNDPCPCDSGKKFKKCCGG